MSEQQTYEVAYCVPSATQAASQRLLWRAGLVATFFLVTWTLWTPVIRLSFITISVFFFALKKSSSPQKKNYTATIDTQGISARAPNNPDLPPLDFAWSDISEVRDKPGHGYLELYTAAKGPFIQIAYGVTGFDQLLQLLLGHVHTGQPAVSLPVSFKKPFLTVFSATILLSPIGFFLVGIENFVFMEERGKEISELFLMVSASLPMTLFGYKVVDGYYSLQSLRINEGGFSITEKFRLTRTEFQAVQSIQLQPARIGSWRSFHGLNVKVTLIDGRELFLCPFGCDPFAIYHMLHTAWEQDRERSSAPAQSSRPETQDFS